MKSLRTFLQIYKRVYQHATVFSAVVVLLLFGLFLEAYMHDFNLVYITLFFVFSLAFSAGPIGLVNIGFLPTKYLSSGRLFANEEGFLALEIQNISKQTAWAISLHSENNETSVAIESIKSQEKTLVKLPLSMNKRGKFVHENVYLESKYPISTARLTLKIDKRYDGIVYPQPKGESLKAFLHTQKNHYGEEKDFDGLMQYDGSQSLSHIHWASVAKGNMSVKIFSKETQIPQLIFPFASIASDDEARLSQLCLWVLACERQHLDFVIELPHKRLNSKKESIDEILSILANY